MPRTKRFALPRVRPIHALTLALAVALLVAAGGWVVAVCGWPGAAPLSPTPEPQDDWFPRPGSGMHIEAPTGTAIEAVPIPPPPAALQLGSLTPTDTSAAKAIYQDHARH